MQDTNAYRGFAPLPLLSSFRRRWSSCIGLALSLSSVLGCGGEVAVASHAELDLALNTSARTTLIVDDYARADDVDDLPAFVRARDALPAGGGTLVLTRAQYVLRGTFVTNKAGLTLQGAGISAVGPDVRGATVIIADHSSGPAIRVNQFNTSLKDLVISASDSRRDGAAGVAGALNMGIQVEGADVDGGRASNFWLQNVRATRQPSHGIALIGEITNTTLDRPVTDANRGHGIVIDRGYLTGRRNISAPPGIVFVHNGRSFDNGGHALAAGNPNDPSLPSYRVVLDLFESYRNAKDARARYALYQVYLNGDDHEVRASAFGGDNVTGGLFVAGRSIRVINNRFIDTTQPLEVGRVGNVVPRDIVIENMEVRGSLTFDPAIVVDPSALGVSARVHSVSKIATLMDTTSTGYRIDDANGLRMDGDFEATTVTAARVDTDLVRAGSFDSLGAITLADNSSIPMGFSGEARGVLVISGNTASAKAAMIHFRVGATQPSCVVMSSSSAGVSCSVGALTGTTGADGGLNISVTADRLLYVENRTGAERSYTITLLSVNGGVLQ